METKHYVIIKVLDVNGNWYNNAFFIEFQYSEGTNTEILSSSFKDNHIN